MANEDVTAGGTAVLEEPVNSWDTPDPEPEAEDPAVMEKFYGPEWKTVLGIEEEGKTDGASGDGANTGAGAGEDGATDTGAASTDGSVAPDAGATSGEGVAGVEGGTAGDPAATAADEELKQLAELGRQWKQAFATDPKKAISELLASPAFTHEDRVALFNQVQTVEAQRAVAIDPAAYEPASDFEKALLPTMDWLRGGEQKVAEALAVRDRDIQHTFVETQALAVQLDAICEFLGLSLPKHDTAAIFKHYDASPEGTLQDAVAKIYREAAIQAAKVEKQKRVERPSTPRNAASGSGAPAKINSMADAWALAGEELGMTD